MLNLWVQRCFALVYIKMKNARGLGVFVVTYLCCLASFNLLGTYLLVCGNLCTIFVSFIKSTYLFTNIHIQLCVCISAWCSRFTCTWWDSAVSGCRAGGEHAVSVQPAARPVRVPPRDQSHAPPARASSNITSSALTNTTLNYSNTIKVINNTIMSVCMYLICPWFFLVVYLAFLMLDVWGSRDRYGSQSASADSFGWIDKGPWCLLTVE